MKKLTMLLAMLMSVACSFAQQRLSGKITDGNVALEGVHIEEVDEANRILNHTYTNASGIYVLMLRSASSKVRVAKQGYETIEQKLKGESRVNFTMVAHATQNVNVLQKLKNAPFVESQHLLEGHDNHDKAILQPVHIEQMSDSTFIICVPVVPSNKTNMYPAGRKMLFLNIIDNRMLTLKCVQDCFPIGNNTIDFDFAIHSPQATADYNIGNGRSLKVNYYLYPCFMFTRKDMDKFIEKKAKNTFRIAIETDDGKGYWFLYPTKTFVTELKRMMDRFDTKAN